MPRDFRNSFLKALEATGWTMPELAARSGVSKDQLNKLKQREGAKTNIDDAVAVANAFGYTIEEFLDDEIVKDRNEAAQLWRQLTDRERHLIISAARELPAPPHEEA